MSRTLLIVGAGQAGLQLAASARSAGFQAPITILGAEDALPYARPPLSKAFLLGKQTADSLSLQSTKFYEQKQIDARANQSAVGVDRSNCLVHLANGEKIRYSELVFATGSRPRPLPLYDQQPDNLYYLRDLRDAIRIKAALPHARSALIIGGGFIGLEFAAVARSLGLEVTVVEAGSRLMARTVSETLSARFLEMHRERGVHVLLRTQVTALECQAGKVRGARVDPGPSLGADIVLVGIGGIANDDLARSCDLECRDGIVVDTHLSTQDPRISAIGDCARVGTADISWRMESVQNAIDQGRYVAQRLVDGLSQPYFAVPWFWSDQFDNKLQIVGAVTGDCDVVMREGTKPGAFGAYHFHRDRLVCVETVNDAAAHVTARMLLERSMSPSRDQVLDPSFNLRTALKTVAST